MADKAEVAGGHDRVDDAAVRAGQVLDKEGNVAAGARSAAYIKRMYGKAPVRVEHERTADNTGKIKFVRHRFYDVGKGQLTEKRETACVYKNGRILNGRWPDGVEMPRELKETILRHEKGLRA